MILHFSYRNFLRGIKKILSVCKMFIWAMLNSKSRYKRRALRLRRVYFTSHVRVRFCRLGKNVLQVLCKSFCVTKLTLAIKGPGPYHIFLVKYMDYV